MPRPGRSPLLLELDLTRAVIDAEPEDLPGRLRARNALRWRRLLAAIEAAVTDRAVAGLVATVTSRITLARAWELATLVERVRAAGKPTLAWADSFGESGDGTAGYLLACAFEEVWLQPTGVLSVTGTAVEVTFLRGLLDRLGIEPQLGQRAEYKAAADRLTRDRFTDAHREMVQRLADSTHEVLLDRVGEGRRLPVDRVAAALDHGPLLADAAVAAGLVDRLGYRDQAYAAIRRRCGGRVTLRYAEQWRPADPRWRRMVRAVERTRAVAVVDLAGAITPGRSRRTPIGPVAGAATVGGALRAAARDRRVGAVVLRVDSPGGSAVASDTIWHEVRRVREAGKPVVVSMAAVAASGGYYVSCGADVIVATAVTLTGSIGVVGGKVVVERLLERLGVTTGAVEQGDRARMFSPRRRFTDEEWAQVQAWLDRVYADFRRRVADGRGLTDEAVEAVARGRVWTGVDARERGLVDQLGGFPAAAAVARDRAGLPADAPLRPALRTPPLARLRPPRSSEDPRSAMAAASLWPNRPLGTELAGWLDWLGLFAPVTLLG